MSESSRLRPLHTPVPLTRAVRAAVVALVSSWLPLALLAVVAWAASARTTVGWGSALGAASLAWVTAHLGSLRDGGTVLTLPPLLLVLLPLAACTVGARSLAGPVEDDRTPRIAWLGGIRSRTAALLGAFVGSYAVLGLLVALHAGTMPVGPSWPSTVLGLLLIPLVGVLVGLRRLLAEPDVAPWWHDHVAALLPVGARRALPLGLRGAGMLLLAGALPLLGTFVVHLSRVRELTGALQAGPLGNVVLAVVQAAWLPDVLAWGLSWLAGPGFAVGVGSTYSWHEARSGLMPMVPLLGSLPDDGTFPAWTAAAGLLPVAVGAVVAHQAVRRLPALSTLATKALAVAAAWLTTVLATLVVLVLSGGSLGSRALAEIGPHVLPVTLALGGELGLGSLLALALAWRRYH